MKLRDLGMIILGAAIGLGLQFMWAQERRVTELERAQKALGNFVAQAVQQQQRPPRPVTGSAVPQGQGMVEGQR